MRALRPGESGYESARVRKSLEAALRPAETRDVRGVPQLRHVGETYGATSIGAKYGGSKG